jgi:hypothetical protein
MRVQMDLANAFRQGATLQEVVRRQHRYHEWRRWSMFDILDRHREANRPITERDRAALWHVARGELTTLSAGVGLADTALEYAKDLEGDNPLGAKVMHAAATWLARYWNEEEAHHEAAYGAILDELCADPVADDEIMEHRGKFPTDNFVRNMILQACVEIEVSVTYAHAAKTSDHPLIKEVFSQISKDEVQHRQYFVSFAQGLIDAGVYPAKDALAMAFHWVKPGGELYGSTRDAQSNRDGYVNWWEKTRTEESDTLAVTPDQHFSEEIFNRKRRSVLKVVTQATRDRYETVESLKKGYFRSLVDRPRSAAVSG